jgi:CRP-like cAMP-binding protein
MYEGNHITCPLAEEFSVQSYLETAGMGPESIEPKGQTSYLFTRNLAEAVFYLQKGRIKLTVVSTAGKEATIPLLQAGDFVGEESIVTPNGLRLASASAITDCIVLMIDLRGPIIRRASHNREDNFPLKLQRMSRVLIRFCVISSLQLWGD